MSMKNPPHPGEGVGKDVIRPLGLSVTKAATLLGVRRATLSDVIHGKATLTAEMALRLEKAFGVSMDLLLKMQAGYDDAHARQNAPRPRLVTGRRTGESVAVSSTVDVVLGRELG